VTETFFVVSCDGVGASNVAAAGQLVDDGARGRRTITRYLKTPRLT